MKLIQFLVVISVLFVSTAIADTVTVMDTPAGIYDTLHAKFAVDQKSDRAFVRVFLMDESSYRECWENLSAKQGISTDDCRVKTHRVQVPGLAYDDANQTVTYNGAAITQDALETDVHYANVDDGTRINSVKHVRVRLQIQ
ncbi:MAG: hypothetical protein PVI54_12490 [Desulfobacteraceae bacterium]|jgi:hypothetical protein